MPHGTKYLQGRLLSGVSVCSLGYTQIDKGLSACAPGLVAWLKRVNERPFYVVYKFYQISMILDSLNKIRKQHLDVKWRINVLFKCINISTLLLTHQVRALFREIITGTQRHSSTKSAQNQHPKLLPK